MKAPGGTTPGLTDLGGGKWRLRVSAGKNPLTGSQRQPSRTFRGTRREAEVALAELRRDLEADPYQAVHGTMTLNDLVELYLSLAEVETLTLKSYWSKYTCHIRPSVVGTTPAAQVTGVNLTRFYLALRDEAALGSSSIRKVHAVIANAFSLAMTMPELDLTRNPARDVKLPKVRRVDKTKDRAPTPEVMDEVMDGIEELRPDTLVALMVAAYAGLRRGEICALRLSDIEVVGPLTFLNVRHSLIQLHEVDTHLGIQPLAHYRPVGERLWMKDTKSHAERRFALDADTAAAMARHLESVVLEARYAGVELANDFFLFSLQKDHVVPWRPDGLSQTWRRLRVKLQHREIRLHDFRHFNGTQLGEAHVSIGTIMKRLGHSQESTTWRYVKGTTAEDLEAALALGTVSKRGALQ